MNLKPKHPGGETPAPRDPGCLVIQDVPAVCLRLQSHRQRIALPYALLLRVELSTDDANCVITFATHEVNVQGRHLQPLYLAVSQGQASQIGIGHADSLVEGSVFRGPLVTQVRIEPVSETDRARR